MNNAQCATAGPRQSGMQDRLGSIQGEINRQESLLNALRERLDTVMLPEEPSKDGGNNPVPLMSPVEHHIWSLEQQITRSNAAIVSLLDRLVV